jgi:hypothetical protein
VVFGIILFAMLSPPALVIIRSRRSFSIGSGEEVAKATDTATARQPNDRHRQWQGQITANTLGLAFRSSSVNQSNVL